MITTYHYCEDKLSEAQFFLRKMKDNMEKISDFRYYFSAFLSASRTVTSLWAKEKDPKFRNWYKEFGENEPLWKFFKNYRDMALHEGVTPLGAGEVFAYELIEIIDGRSISRGIYDLRYIHKKDFDKNVEFIKQRSEVLLLPKSLWVFKNFPSDLKCKNDVVEVSAEFVDVLTRFLYHIYSEFLEKS